MALLLHGLTGTPFEMRHVAERLHRDGLRCVGPVMAGHGGGPRALAGFAWQAWVEGARRELDALRGARRVYLVGCSMGALVACALAHAAPERVAGLALLAPALHLQRAGQLAALLGRLPFAGWLPPVPKVAGSDVRDPDARRENPTMSGVPVRAVAELAALSRHVDRLLPDIAAPALVVAAREDHTVRLSGADAHRAAPGRAGAAPGAGAQLPPGGHRRRARSLRRRGGLLLRRQAARRGGEDRTMTTERRLASYVMAIDQGTTGTTVLILDKRLAVRAKVNVEFRQIFPKPGWVEHDARGHLGLGARRGAARRSARRARAARTSPRIGITNQRETIALWDRRSGKPIHNAIVWQDRRTTERCARLQSEGHEPLVREKTGLVLDPYFSATKLAWLLENVRGARGTRRGRASSPSAPSTASSSGASPAAQAHVTDASNASRTLLMDLRTLRLGSGAARTLRRAGRASCRRFVALARSTARRRACARCRTASRSRGIAGDQQAALFGQACFAPGDAKCTYGTGAFLLQNTGPEPVASQHGLLTTVALARGWRGRQYALEGSAFIAGAAVQWLRDRLRIIKKASDVEALAESVKDSGERGVRAGPGRAGRAALAARGAWTHLGINRGTTAGHLARALLEGIAFQIYDLAEAMMKDAGRTAPAFRVDGGASANDLLMQFQADLLDVPVERPRMIETTALGAAFLAGLAAGVWSLARGDRQELQGGQALRAEDEGRRAGAPPRQVEAGGERRLIAARPP